MSDTMNYLNDMARGIFALNEAKGWHTGQPDLARYLMNLHSEVSELWEAWRAGTLEKLCDKADRMPEPLTCLEEELADILIRTLDTAHTFGVDIDRAVRVKLAFNVTRPHRHGGKLA